MKEMIKLFLLLFFAIVLAACSGSSGGNGGQSPSIPTAQPVNGFGTASNHVHSLLALPSGILVMATHYGIFRSQDGGTTWQKVTSGPGQLMQGLMEYSLTKSPIDLHRLYVLTQIAIVPHAGTLGLYTSADEGKTWQLMVTTASITSGVIYFAAAGNDTLFEVYIYLPALGALGLRVSLDNGQHFSSPGGTLPFGSILGLLAIPGAPGHLLAYGSDGLASSSDGGNHWHIVKNMSGGIFEMTTAGPHSPIYASGGAGIYSSLDGGTTFTLVYTKASYGSLTASPTHPQTLYGKAGLGIFRSTDGGHTWSPLPDIKGNLAVLAADPSRPSEVYLSLSYPTAVYRLQSDGKGWQSLTPSP